MITKRNKAKLKYANTTLNRLLGWTIRPDLVSVTLLLAEGATVLLDMDVAGTFLSYG